MEIRNTSKDLHLFESGSGGDFEIINNDLSLSETIFQSIYISLFGGNIETSTLGNEVAGQERYDYWGNSLLFSENKNKQFNSETERVLDNIVLNSSGRLQVKQAVENDLIYLKNIAIYSVDIFILSRNSLKISISLTSLSNQATTLLAFIFDNASNEIITERTI